MKTTKAKNNVKYQMYKDSINTVAGGGAGAAKFWFKLMKLTTPVVITAAEFKTLKYLINFKIFEASAALIFSSADILFAPAAIFDT